MMEHISNAYKDAEKSLFNLMRLAKLVGIDFLNRRIFLAGWLAGWLGIVEMPTSVAQWSKRAAESLEC